MKRSLLVQAWILSGVLWANFIAQVFYYLHLYYSTQHPLPEARGALLMGLVFALFLAGSLLLILETRAGYYLMAAFLALDFLFYLWNLVNQALHGYGWFYHLAEPDPVLWTVFLIGYLNFFAAGYYLVLLLVRRREILDKGQAGAIEIEPNGGLQ